MTVLARTNDCQSVVVLGMGATFAVLAELVNAPDSSTDWPGAASLEVQNIELVEYDGFPMSIVLHVRLR